MKKFITILLLIFTTHMMGQVKVIEQVNNNKHTLLIFLDGQLHQVEKYVRRRDELVPIGVWEVFDEDGDTIKKSTYRNGKLTRVTTLINGDWVTKKVIL